MLRHSAFLNNAQAEGVQKSLCSMVILAKIFYFDLKVFFIFINFFMNSIVASCIVKENVCVILRHGLKCIPCRYEVM